MGTSELRVTDRRFELLLKFRRCRQCADLVKLIDQRRHLLTHDPLAGGYPFRVVAQAFDLTLIGVLE